MVIVGAKGLAKQLLPELIKLDIKNIAFFDDQNNTSSFLYTYPIIYSLETVREYFQQDSRFVLGIGRPIYRKKLCDSFENLGGQVMDLISNQANVSEIETRLFEGIIILPSAIIESFVTIKKGSLINIGAKVCHDSSIGQFCEIGPNVTITGNCFIGDETSIGASATLIPNIKVGNNVTVGAGSVVINNLPDNCVAVGVPAKIIKYL